MLCGWEGNRSLSESNGSLPPGGYGLTACASGSAPDPTLGNEYGKPSPFLIRSEPNFQTLYVSIRTYPGNFIDLTDMVQRIQQFEL